MEAAGLLGCDIASLGEWLLAYQRNTALRVQASSKLAVATLEPQEGRQ
jgi:hypothetical protein